MDNQGLQNQPYLTFFAADTAEYDVIVDQSSSAPNLKEATWGALQPLLPMIVERAGPDEIGLIFEYSPLPESFLEKYKALQDKKAQQPPPPDPEMEKIKAQQQAKQAELQMNQQATQQQMHLDAQIADHQAQIEQSKTAAQIQLEREKAIAAIQLEREKAAAQFELEKAKAQQQLQMDKQRMAFDAQKSKHDMALKSATTRASIQHGAMKTASDAMDTEDSGDAPDLGETDLFGNKAIADAVVMMSQALVQMEKSNSESIRALAEALTKPKQIVRGPDGRAVGVQ